MLFLLWTHAYIFTDEVSKKHGGQEHAYSPGIVPPEGQSVFRVGQRQQRSPQSDIESYDATTIGHGSQYSKAENDEEELPQLSIRAAILLLVGTTIITGFTAEFLVSFSRFGLRVRV